jgi:hypothetical protein
VIAPGVFLSQENLWKMTCGSGLARDTSDAVCQAHCADTIASKPAPTKKQAQKKAAQ